MVFARLDGQAQAHGSTQLGPGALVNQESADSHQHTLGGWHGRQDPISSTCPAACDLLLFSRLAWWHSRLMPR